MIATIPMSLYNYLFLVFQITSDLASNLGREGLDTSIASYLLLLASVTEILGPPIGCILPGFFEAPPNPHIGGPANFLHIPRL